MQEESCSSANPWVQEMLDHILDVTRSGVLKWCSILTKIGMDKEDRSQWTTTFTGKVNEVYKNMIQEATVHQNKLFVEIETLLQKSESLCKDLHIKMPGDGSKGLSLSEEKNSGTRYENDADKTIYESMAEEKRKVIASLNEQEYKLCRALGRTPRTIPESPLPTPQFMHEFTNYLESLESEKFTREEKFCEIKSSIMEIVKELSFTPTLDFEKAVISSDDSLFLVTDNNMTELNNFYESLKQQLGDTKEISSLRDRIKFLWELLAEDLKDCDAFSEKHTGNSLSTLDALRQELNRCESVIKANIEVFVKRLRDELVTLWDKCHFSDRERDFEYFHSNLYTEDLLTLHYMEIRKVKEYYTQNSELFNLLEKRAKLWAHWIMVEEQATSPARLENRKGQLLKEEKDRKGLLKQLTKTNERLVELAKVYNQRSGKQFLSWGETVDAVILNSQQKHDEDKKLKLSARKQKRDELHTPGTSTQGTNAKKRKPVSPLLAPAKCMCVLNEGNENDTPSGV